MKTTSTFTCALLVFLGGALAQSAAAQSECAPLTPSGAAALAGVLDDVSDGGDCTLEGTRTVLEVSSARWLGSDGQTHEVLITPTGCRDDVTRQGRVVDLTADGVFQQACPQVWASIEQRVLPQSFETASGVTLQPGAGRATEPPTHPGSSYRRRDMLGGLLAAVTWLLLIGVALRSRRWILSRRSVPWVGVTLAALVVRLAVTPGLANWYTEVLPAEGGASGRFGPGVFVVQRAIRAVLPWTDTTWYGVNLVLGAVAVPLLIALLRNLSLPRIAWVAGGLLLCISPLHVRVSASPSAHVLAAAYLLAGMVAWTSGVRLNRRSLLVLGGLLAACAATVRVDMLPQAALLPLWGGAACRAPWRRLVRPTAVFALAWALLAVWMYLDVVVPARHPRPDLTVILSHLPRILTQFAVLASTPPYYVSWLVVGLAALGAVVLLGRRPRVFAALAVFLIAAFAPVFGDLSREGVVTARYFLVVLALVAGMAGMGLSACIPRRWTAVAQAGTLAAVALISLALTQPALHHRTAFQDEYRFLRGALAELADGCQVVQVDLRPEVSAGQDLDCCLSMPTSPLVIAFPNLDFTAFQSQQRLTHFMDAGECLAYYHSSACSLDAGAWPGTPYEPYADYFLEHCGLPTADGWQPVREGRVSGYAFGLEFRESRPRVGLYRWVASDLD